MSKDGARGRIRTDDPRFTNEGRGEVEGTHEAHGTQEENPKHGFGRPLWHPEELRPRWLYTYFLAADGLPYFKVGRTRALARRLSEIQIGCPVRCDFVCALRGDVEYMLHASLREYRSSGEWFETCAESLDTLVTLGLEPVAHAIWRSYDGPAGALEAEKPKPRRRRNSAVARAVRLLEEYRSQGDHHIEEPAS